MYIFFFQNPSVVVDMSINVPEPVLEESVNNDSVNDIEPDHNPINEYHILCALVIYIVHFYNYDHDDEIKCINSEYCFFI